MKNLFFTTSLLVGLTAGITAIGQKPVNWTCSAKKLADKTYEVSFTATVAEPWHIYSQTTPDGGPSPTSFQFSKNPIILLDGKTMESGKIVTKYEEVFGVNVLYFDGTASFIQKVKLKAGVKTSLSGKIEFMACHDQQCLPPTAYPFTVALQ